MNEQKKVAVITGGDSGIGFCLARKLLNENYKVVITSRRGQTEDSNPKLSVVELELRSQESINNAVAEIIKLVPKIDLLVNNAGIAPDVFLEKTNYQAFSDTLSVNLTGTIFFTESLLPFLNVNATVMNVSSEMSLSANAQPNAYGYRISKAGLNFYTRLLALVHKNTNIRVVAIHPGWVRTKLGGEDAPIDPEMAANRIMELLASELVTGTFVNLDSGQSLAL